MFLQCCAVLEVLGFLRVRSTLTTVSRVGSVTRPDLIHPARLRNLLARTESNRPVRPPDPTRLNPRESRNLMIRPAGRAMTREKPR